MQGHQWLRPQQSFRQPPPGSPPQVSEAVRTEEERKAHRQQMPQYEALARMERQHCSRQPPSLEPKTIYWLEMEVGRGGAENKGKQEGAGERRSGQPSGGPQGEERHARRSGGGSGGHPEGQATGEGEGRRGKGDRAAAGRHDQQERGQGSGRQQGVLEGERNTGLRGEAGQKGQGKQGA